MGFPVLVLNFVKEQSRACSYHIVCLDEKVFFLSHLVLYCVVDGWIPP